MTAQIVRKIALGAFSDAIDILSLIETLEAGNSPEAVSRINAAGTDAVLHCIYRAMWSRLLIMVTRAYANARCGDMHAQYAFDLLKNETVRSEIEMSGDRDLLDQAVALWGKCRGDHRRQSIEDFRDKQIAHSGQTQISPPIINDIFALSRSTAEALGLLARGTGVVNLSIEGQLLNYRTKANCFWQNLS